MVADINDAGSDETVEMVQQAGGTAMAVHADVAQRHDVEAMIAAATDSFGRLDVLYNNAAVQMSGTLAAATVDDWDDTIATNLTAIFWACRAGIPAMLAGPPGAEGGSIINTSSVLGLVGSEGYVAYGAAKAALIALTRQIALEFGPHIRANVIAPGSIDTPRFRKVADDSGDPTGFVAAVRQHIPLDRLGTAGDVARVALFLASDASAYTSGAIIPVDGGLAVLR